MSQFPNTQAARSHAATASAVAVLAKRACTLLLMLLIRRQLFAIFDILEGMYQRWRAGLLPPIPQAQPARRAPRARAQHLESAQRPDSVRRTRAVPTPAPAPATMAPRARIIPFPARRHPAVARPPHTPHRAERRAPAPPDSKFGPFAASPTHAQIVPLS